MEQLMLLRMAIICFMTFIASEKWDSSWLMKKTKNLNMTLLVWLCKFCNHTWVWSSPARQPGGIKSNRGFFPPQLWDYFFSFIKCHLYTAIERGWPTHIHATHPCAGSLTIITSNSPLSTSGQQRPSKSN